jgi:hypothetical protein
VTQARRDWLATFANPAVLSDLFAAARDCMAQVCDHEAHECPCPENRMTMVEFAEWVELEVKMAEREPVRFEPAGRPRRKAADQLRLSLAG